MTAPDLSPDEMAVLHNRTFMPLKAAVCRKVEALLSDTYPLLADIPTGEILGKLLPATTPKISKGENYHSYAYRLLDYPRMFSGDDMFLFRVMMLWGHHVSIHLIMSGAYQQELAQRLWDGRHHLAGSWYVALTDTPWEWTPTQTDQQLLQELTQQEMHQHLTTSSFVKLSQFFPLDQLPQLPSLGVQAWQEINALL